MAPASSVKRRLLPLATLLVAAVLNPVGSFANPTGANVTGGAAMVSGQGTSRVTIDQSSDRAFIEWNSFSVAKGESVRFNQPSASSVTANKVVGVAPSDILGAVSANGRIILINPNGIFFGKGSTIDAAGLIATTLDLDKDSFLAGGKLKFSSVSDISASVVNEGTLTISDAGLGALVAPHVRNSGALVANLGTAVLASGKAFTVDFTGDGLITFALGEGIASTLVGADGQPLKAQVEQAGEVTASRIVLSAAAAREVVNQSVNVSGLVRAGSADRNADGSISLRGSKSVAVESTAVLEAPAGSIVLDADSVKVAGNIIASSIQLTGDTVAVLTGASLSSNGGSILVGGDWQGSHGVRQAITTTLEAGATIDAGQGGKVVLWSDITNADSVTTVAGTVRALGGRIETSGHLLELPGVVQAGIGGSWLIDPTNVSITTTSTTGTLPGDLANAGVTNIKATDIQAAVNSGSSVSIIATGTITQSTALAFAPAAGLAGSLTLDTRTGTNASKITLAGITNSGAGTVNVSAYAAGVIATTAGITSSSGPINLILQSFNATNSSVSGLNANVLLGAAVTTRGGYVILDGTGGTITGTSLTRGSIAHGMIYANGSFIVNTTTIGGGPNTAGGDFSAASSSSASTSAFSSHLVTYNIGGKFTVNVATSLAASWGFVTSSYLTTSPITAYGDLSITTTSTATALSVANLYVSSALTSTTGSVTLSNTSTGALATNAVGALTINAAVNGSTGVTITNSSVHTATASAQNGINGSGAITSSLGAIAINSTTNSTAIPLNYTGALSAKTGITVNASGATGASIANLAAITLTGAGSNLSITANNTSAGGASGIVTAGAIGLASGSGLSFVSNKLINQTGAISVAANVSGAASNMVFDTTTGSSASAITTGNVTFLTGSTNDINLTIRSKGSALDPGTVGTSLLNLPGVLTIDNTNGGTVTAANAVAGIGLTLNGAIYASKSIVLSGVSNGNNAIQTSAAVVTANGNLVVNALGTTAIAYSGSAAAGTLTATNGSVSLTSVSTTGSAINIVTGATITAKTGITINATSTTAATVATVDVLTVTGAGANISFAGNASAAGALLGVGVGNVNLANGSSLSLVSNNKITQTGTIANAINTNGAASSILFDATTGSNASAVTIGTLTVAAATSTSDINLLVKSKGSAITAAGPLATAAIPLPGTITFDNTNGGTITQATAVAGVGLTFNGGGVFGSKGISLTGVSNNNSAITSNQLMTSSLGAVTLTGNTLTTGNLWGITATGTITGKSITVTATNNTTGTLATGGAVNLGALGILAGGTDLTITGNNSNQTAQGVVTGAVTSSAVGGNVTFLSDNNVTSGAISLVANTSATTATVSYDVTSGNKTSAITAGALTIGAGTNASGIDYKLLTRGAPIVVGAVTVPGQIVLDNTYGAVSGPAASGFITLANAATYANITTHGINISGALSGAQGITIKGATAGNNLHGVYTTGSLLAATGNIEGTGISITGTTGSGFYINGHGALVTATTGNITFTGFEWFGNVAVVLNSGAISAPLGSFTANGSAGSTGSYGLTTGTSATISAKNNVTLTGTTSGTYGIKLNAAVTSTAGDIIISAQSGTNTAYMSASALNASTGVVTLSAITTTGDGVNQTGLVTAKSATITGTINGTGTAVTLGAVTLVAGGGNLVVTGNNANQAGTGISQTGNITDNVVGGNILFRSNNNINQAGAITMVSNPGTTAAALTYDVSTGNNTSSIIAGSLTITGTNTGPIDYNLYAAGAQLNPGAIAVPGTITLDNTYGGTAGIGGTPTSGFINASNLSLATTSYGIIVDSALSGAKGVTVRGASYGGSNVMGVLIWSNITSSQGDIELVGYTLSGYGLTNVNPGVTWLTTTISAPLGRLSVTGTAAGTSGNAVDFYAANTLSAKNITVTGAANGTGLAARVGNVVVLAGGGDLLVVGNNSNQSGTGISVDAGTIANNAVGGSITFRSNNNINQTTAIGLVGNTSGQAAALTYDVTTGTNASSIVGGNLTITGSSTSPINYNLLASGARLDGGALNIPGTITLDNTYGGTAGVGGAPTSGFITSANIASAVATEGISINNAMTGANGVIIKGVSSGSNAINTTSTLTATTGNVSISGTSGTSTGYTGSGALVATAGNVLLTGQSNTGSAINFSGTVTANTGNVVITGNAASTGNTWGTLASGLISAKNITVTGTNNTTGTLTAGGAVYLGALTIVASGGNLLVDGNNSNQLSGGVYQIGAITHNANGGSILFKSNNNINQTGTLALAMNTSGADSSVTYDLTTGNKTSTLVAGNLTVAAGSTSGINYNVYTSGSNLNPGATSVPGVITLDNTWGGTAGVGGTPTSGFITAANRATLATTSNGMTVNNALTGGKGVVLRGITSTGGRGVDVFSAVSAPTGNISIYGLGGFEAGFVGNTGASLTANTGSIDIYSYSVTGNGLYNVGAIGAKTINVLGEVNHTSSAVWMGGTFTVFAGGTGLSVTGNNPNQSGQGVYATGGVVVNANGGNVLFRSNNNINHTGNITMVANTSGQASAVTYDVSTGGKSSTIVTGNLSITAGSTSNIDFNQYTAGATINPGAISVPGVITLDNTYGAASAGATPVSGYLNASTLSSALVTSSDGITVNNTLSGAAGVVLRGVSFGGGAVSGASAVTSTLGAIDVLGISTTGNGVALTGLLTAKGVTLTGTRTLSSANSSVRQGALTILALTAGESAAGVLGNVLITGNSFDQAGNGVYAYGNITSNANGGSVTFRSNNNINQTGTVSMVANTSGHSSAITYDVSTGNKTSSIVTTNSVIAAGSTSGIDYNMFASGAALNPGLIRVPGVITLDNTYGAATAGATPVSGFITAANLATLATTSNPVVINQGNALSGDRGVTIRSVVNSGIYGVAIMLLDNITSSQGDISLAGTAANGFGIGNLWPNVQWYASALSAPSGRVSLTGTIAGSGNGIAVAVGLDGYGSITAKTIDVVGNATGPTGNAVRLGRLNILAGGGDLTVTGNTVTQSGYGIYQEGTVTIGGNGSSATFRSNNNITQNGLISVVANTSGQASAVTYDVSRGDKASAVLINTPLTIAAGSTSRIDYNMFASGAVLNAGSLPTIPGVITVDNTYGTATAGGTPVSGFLTTGNIALATTSNAIVINAGQPLVGQYGVVLRGATNGNAASKAILINDNITSVAGTVVLDGVAGSGYGVYYPSAAYGLNGRSITVIGNNLGTSTIAPVYIGKLNLLAGGGDLSVTGNKTTAGGAAGIVQNGVISSLSSGGSLRFASNNVITQNGAVSVVANVSGHTAEIAYDTTAGNKLSIINPGVVSFVAGSTSDIHYKNLSSGAEIIVNSALNVPGSITLDNTWLNGVSGGITAANASTFGTSLHGLQVATNLTASGGITLKGVTGSASTTYKGVSVTAGTFTATGTFTVGQDAISITGVSAGVTANQSAVSLTGTVAIINNSINGNTSLIALGGRYYDPVIITNASTAGAIAISAIGDSAAVVTTTATTVTQNSNAGVYILSSNNGNVTPPKIINNGTGPVAIAAGAYLPVGVATGGQIVGLNGNSITSPNGNVLLYSGMPTVTSNSTTATSQNTLAYLDAGLGALDFGNTLFGKAYAAGNVAAGSPITSAAGLNTSEIFNALGSNNTATGSAVGPAIQFRFVAQANLLLSDNFTKVYGTDDPSAAYDSVAIAGSLENLLNARLIRNSVKNPGFTVVGGIEYFNVVANGVQFRLPMADFMNSVTGTRAQYGTLAGEQVTPGGTPYAYALTSRHGVLMAAGVDVTLVGNSAKAPYLGLEITPAPLSLTQSGQTKTYGQTLAPVGTGAQASGVINGVTVNGVTINDVLDSFTMSSAGFAPTANIGTYAITPGGLSFSTGSASNYAISSNAASVTVNRASLVVTAKDAVKFEGMPDTAGFLGVDYAGFANGENSSVLLSGGATGITVTRDNSAVNAIGAYPGVLIAAGPATRGNYAITYAPGDFEIKILPPNTLAVIADTYATYGTTGGVSALSSVVYKDSGSVLRTLSYSSGSGTATSGSYVYADGTNGNVTFTLVPSSTALSSAGKLIVGAYALVGSGTLTTTIPNLTNTLLVAGNLNIVPANASVTATATSLIYDATVRTQSAATTSGFLSGDVITIAGAQATGTHAGTYASAISVASGNANGDLQNYNVTLTDANLTVTPAPLTLTGAGTVTKVYDATTDATLAFSGATLSGVFAGDAVGFDATALTAVYVNKNVGTRALVISGGAAALTGVSAGDYVLTGLNAFSGTITPAPLSLIGVGNTTKVYDRTTTATLNAAGSAVSGLLAGDDVAFSPTALSAVFADKNVGTGKTLTVTAGASALSGADAGNYAFTNLTSFSGSITPASLTLAGVGSATKVYDGTIEAPLGLGSSSVSGVVSGDTVSFSSAGLTAAFADKNVGTVKGITLTAGASALTGLDAGNYVIANLSAFTGTITRAAVTLNATGSVTKVYDRTTAASLGVGAFIFTGVVSGDDVTLDSAQVSATFPNKNVGAGKALVVAAGNSALSGSDAGNYSLTVGTGFVGEITPAPLTLTGFGTVTKVYDATVAAALSTGSVTLSGILSGDTVTANASALAATFDDKNVGTGKSLFVSNAAVVLAGADAGNYLLQAVTGLTGTITAAPLSIGGLSVPSSKVYDGTTATIVSGTPTFVGLLGADSVSLAGAALGSYNTKDVATANTVSFTGLTVSGVDAGNYVISSSYSLPATITPAALTMTGLTVAASKVYDGNTSAVVGGAGVLFGVFGSDAVALSGTAVGTYDSKNVVTASEVAFSGLTLGGADAANYTFTIQSPVAATITPKTLTLSGLITPGTKTYDGTTAASVSGAGVLSGVVGSDTVSIAGTVVGTFDSPDVASASQVSFAGAILSGAASSNYVLTQQSPTAATITPATLTVTANADARFVGQTDATGFNGVSYAGFVAGQDVSTAGLTGTLTITRSNVATGSAGTYAGVLTPAGLSAGNYVINNVGGDYQIIPAGQVLVKVANTTNVYGAASNYAVSSVEYVNGGSSLVALTLGSSSGSTFTYDDGFGGSLTFTLGANGTLTPAGFLPVGNYAVAGSGIGKVGANFTGTPTIIGVQTVTPKALTTTASKVYDGTTVYTSAQVGLNGVLAGDTVSATGSADLATAGVASGKSYDLTGLSLAGTQAGNYFVDASANATNGVVATKALTVTLLSDSKTYDGLAYLGGKGATYAGFVNGEDATVLGGALAFGGSSQNAVNAGSYAISGSGFTSSNYAISYVPSTLTVNKAALTVVAADASRTYGAANPTFTTALTGFVNGETLATSGVTGSGSATSVAVASSNVGTYAIVPSASGYASNNYDFTGIANGRLTVTPATLTVTANAATRQYGLANPDFAGTVTGFVNGQSLATATTGTLAFSTPATVASNVGSYDVTGYGLTANNGNYIFAQAAGNVTALAVTPATLTVTAVADSKTYNALAYTGGNGVTYAGFRNADSTADLAGTLAFTGTSQGATNAGSYVLTPGGLSAGNYALSFVNGTLTVGKASLTIQAIDANRVYGSANPSFSANLLGFVNGENATTAGITGAAGVTSVATATSNVGNYAVTPTAGTLAAANYVFPNTIDGVLTITPATLTITANAATRQYGLANPVFTGVVSGFVNADSLANATTGTLTFATTATQASNVGSYALAASGLTANQGNYLFVEAPANGTAFTVTPAALTVTALADTKTYNGLAYAGGQGVTYAGFRNGDAATGLTGSLAYVGSSQGAINAGTYAITPSGLSSANYAVSFVDGALTVAKASLTVTGGDGTRVYGAANPGLTSTISGFVNGESFSNTGISGAASVTTAATATSNVGAYAIVPAAGTLAAANYVFDTFVNGSLAVTPATLTVTANAATRLYGAVDPAFAGTVSGFVNGDTLATATTGTLLFTSSASVTSNVGSYALTGFDLLAKYGNYVFVQDAANATALAVTPAPLTATAISDAKTYDGVAYAGGAGLTYDGFRNGDTAATLTGPATYSGTSQGATNVGSYVLTPGGLTNPNYTISYAPGTLTVNPAVLTATLVSSDKVYDGNTSATGSLTLTGLVGSETLGVSATYAFNNKNVNLASTVTASSVALADGTGLASNYVLASGQTATAYITPLTVTVTGVTAVSKVYDATDVAALTGTAIVTPLSGAGDSPAVIGTASATFADKNVGTAKAVTVGGYSLSGVGASNYTLVAPAGLTADITPASLRVAVNDDAKFVTTLDPANFNGVSLSGFLGADSLADVSGSATITRSNSGVNGAGTYAGVLTATGLSAQNYVMNYVAGDFTVVPADRVLVRVANETVVYGTAANPTVQSVQYFNGSTGLVSLTRVGSTNTFDDGVLGGNGTVTFSVIAANPLLSVGGNLRVGTYGLGVDATSLVITGTNFTGTPVVAGTLNVTPLSVQVAGLTAANKAYDRNNAATVTGGTVASLTGDVVVVSTAGVVASFADKMAANGKSVTAAGYALTGADASNYQLVQPSAVTADITPISLTVSGATALNKAYDGTSVATISGGAITLAAGEAVSLVTSGVVGAFADAAVADGKSVTASGFALSGADATNYVLVQPSGFTADITRRQLTFSNVAAASKVYDRTTATTGSLSLVGVVGSESVQADVGGAAFVDKNVGTGKIVNLTGITLSGTDAGNYAIVSTATATADITPLALTLISQAAASKVYDATMLTTGSVALSGVITGDAVGVTTPNARFADKNVGTGKAVNLTGITLTGADAGNYSVASSTTALANITTLTLNVTGVTAANKAYDRLTAATISGGVISILGADIVNLDVSGASGVFADKNAAAGKTVNATGYVISGADAANYSLVQPSGVTADITPLYVTLSGLSASDKTYDGSTAAKATGTLVGVLAGDAAQVSSLTGAFADAEIGTGKTVTITTGVLTGADAINYRITPGQTTTASITRKDDGTNNFLLGASRIAGIGGFKSLDSSDFKYPLPKTFLLGSAGAVKQGEPATLTTGEIGARPVTGYYTSEEQPTGTTSFRYVYPKVNLGQAYYVGALGGAEATAAGGETTETAEAK